MDALVAEAPATATLPRGPRTPRLWQSIRFALWPYDTVAMGARRWGERYTVAAIGQRGKMVVFTDPDGIKDIFTADADELRSGEAIAPVLGPILGWHSILLLDGARHHRERRLMAPPFHGARMHVHGRLMRELPDPAIDRWPVGRPFPIPPETPEIAPHALLAPVLGINEGPACPPVS